MEEKINYDTQLLDQNTGEVIPIQAGTKIISPDRQKQKQEYSIKVNQTFTEKNEKYSATQELRGNFLYHFVRKRNYFTPKYLSRR